MKWLVVFFVFSGIILSSFQHKTNLVLVEQIESNFPIVIRYDSIKDYITLVFTTDYYSIFYR